MKVSQQRQNSQINTINYPQKTPTFKAKYKTEKCRYLAQQGYCPFGEMCAFAHDFFEMRDKACLHKQYKTRPCLNFTKAGYCRYGDRCLFMHSEARDRERTRSNSPDKNNQQHSELNSMRHQKNLRLLSNYGFSVFQAYLNRKESKVMSWMTCCENELTRESESSYGQSEFEDQNPFEWNSRWDDLESSPQDEDSQKKPRMNSL